MSSLPVSSENKSTPLSCVANCHTIVVSGSPFVCKAKTVREALAQIESATKKLDVCQLVTSGYLPVHSERDQATLGLAIAYKELDFLRQFTDEKSASSLSSSEQSTRDYATVTTEKNKNGGGGVIVPITNNAFDPKYTPFERELLQTYSRLIDEYFKLTIGSATYAVERESILRKMSDVREKLDNYRHSGSAASSAADLPKLDTLRKSRLFFGYKPLEIALLHEIARCKRELELFRETRDQTSRSQRLKLMQQRQNEAKVQQQQPSVLDSDSGHDNDNLAHIRLSYEYGDAESKYITRLRDAKEALVVYRAKKHRGIDQDSKDVDSPINLEVNVNSVEAATLALVGDIKTLESMQSNSSVIADELKRLNYRKKCLETVATIYPRINVVAAVATPPENATFKTVPLDLGTPALLPKTLATQIPSVDMFTGKRKSVSSHFSRRTDRFSLHGRGPWSSSEKIKFPPSFTSPDPFAQTGVDEEVAVVDASATPPIDDKFRKALSQSVLDLNDQLKALQAIRVPDATGGHSRTDPTMHMLMFINELACQFLIRMVNTQLTLLQYGGFDVDMFTKILEEYTDTYFDNNNALIHELDKQETMLFDLISAPTRVTVRSILQSTAHAKKNKYFGDTNVTD